MLTISSSLIDYTSNLTGIDAAAAASTIKNHPVTQDLANGRMTSHITQIWHSCIQNAGPAAQSIKNQANATSSEFTSLAGARQPPSYSAANDTPLTRKNKSDCIEGSY